MGSSSSIVQDTDNVQHNEDNGAINRPKVQYVKYVPEIHCVNEMTVKVWWFPSDFCQSRLGDRVIGSNACTLIAVIMAHHIEGQAISILSGHCKQQLNRYFISALAESIVDGNEIHEQLVGNGQQKELDLTIPEAMRASVGQHFNSATHNKHLKEFKTVFQTGDKTRNLFEDLRCGIAEFETDQICSPIPDYNLFMVLISCGRSVLIVYQCNLPQVTLIDTHGHEEMGAVVAQVTIDKLEDLCKWYLDVGLKVYNCWPKSYELSFLYFK